MAKLIAKMREQLKIAKQQKANSSTSEDNTLEEVAYQRKLEWLRDHGETNQDESPDELDESPDNEQAEKWQAPVGAVHSIHSNSENVMECFASTAQLLRPKKKPS